jgi:hypothetical protein
VEQAQEEVEEVSAEFDLELSPLPPMLDASSMPRKWLENYAKSLYQLNEDLREQYKMLLTIDQAKDQLLKRVEEKMKENPELFRKAY